MKNERFELAEERLGKEEGGLARQSVERERWNWLGQCEVCGKLKWIKADESEKSNRIIEGTTSRTKDFEPFWSTSNMEAIN